MLLAIASFLALHGKYAGKQICANYHCQAMKAAPISCDLMADLYPNAVFGDVAGRASFGGGSYTLNWVRTGDQNLLAGGNGDFSLNLWLDAGHRLKKVVLEERLPDGRWTWTTCRYGS